MPLESSLRSAYSTLVHDYTEVPPEDEFDKLWFITAFIPSIDRAKRRTNPCAPASALPSRVEETKKDVAIALASGELTPDLHGFLEHKLKGGYGVSGSGPYLHTNKRTTLETTPHFAGAYWFKKPSGERQYIYGGLQLDSLTIRGEYEANDNLFSFEGVALGSGDRTEVTSGFVAPTCVPEWAYRVTDCVPTFGEYGQAALTGLKFLSYEWTYSNGQRTDPMRQDGVVIEAREHPDPSTTLRLLVKGEPGDALDALIAAGAAFTFHLQMPNRTPNREANHYFPKLDVLSHVYVPATSVRIAHHNIELLALDDTTSGATSANSPSWSTVQTGTETYERAAA